MLRFGFCAYLQVVLAVSAGLVASALADGCTINLSADIPKYEPVLLTRANSKAQYALFKPTGQTTTLPVGAQLLLVCPGKGNVIESLQQSSLELNCNAGNSLKNAAKVSYQLKQLGCTSIPTSVLQLTTQSCADNRGHIFEAGFEYGAANQFASLFQICYDNATENAFYTRNVINGAAMNYAIQESTRRAFRAEGMQFTTTATNKLYTINNQKTRFAAIFGANQPYVSTTSFMARGHLTPDADFVFSYEQLATYFYANVAPEFQVVNAGNWIRVENLARSLAIALGGDLEVYNGYMGTLQLPHPSTKKPISVYLDDTEKIEAPKYYFKVLKHAATDAAVVLVTLNNPFATAADTKAAAFCTNICQKAGLDSTFFADATRGYTFCCTLNDFRKSYADLPKTLAAKNLLTDSKSGGVAQSTTPVTVVVEERTLEADGCSITMPTDIPNPEPVYIVTTPKQPQPTLLSPTGQVTTLPVGSSLKLHCPGSGNTLVDMDQQTLTLTCKSDKTFYSAEKSKSYKLAQLSCSSIPTSDLLTTSTPCSDGQGYVFDAGFTVDTGFHPLFTICYDNRTETTLYSRSIINGATQNFKINESTRRAFRANGMRYTTTATNKFYTKNQQQKRFEALFGADQSFVSSSSFLARGHLTPDADFIFGYEQLATYFYVNVAPEFQVVNAGNWIRVENQARSLAANFASDLLTFTSTLGVLQLPTAKKQLKSIYVDDKELIKTPMWYYKIMMHPQLPVDLVMITLNNPFADAANVVEFCTNVCDLYNVNNEYYKDASRGYTFCCTLEDFASAVPNLPTFDLPAKWSFKN